MHNCLLCPVCKKTLQRSDKKYICPQNHCFDVSREGYVNLLLSQRGGTHGDNKQMIQAREKFLSGGFYSPLCEEICEQAKKHLSDGCVLIDCGCGEGYYTDKVYRALKEDLRGVTVCGFDISRDAVKYACRRNKEIPFFVAGVYDMPFADECADMLTSVFSPFAREEFLRVLKKGGTLISVIPDKRHLWSLKSALYDTPYENELSDYEIEGFEFLGKSEIKNKITLRGEQISALFVMTPYYYRTKPSDKEKILAKEEMEIETEFQVLVYRKI